jgi:hypothetical protein
MSSLWDDAVAESLLLGDYKMTITGYDRAEPAGKTKYIELAMTDGESVANVKFYISEKALKRFARICRAAGVTKAEFEQFDPGWLGRTENGDFLDLLIGRTINCRFDWDKQPNYNGEFFANYQDCWGADVKPSWFISFPFVKKPRPESVAKTGPQIGGGPQIGAPPPVSAAPTDDGLPF